MNRTLHKTPFQTCFLARSKVRRPVTEPELLCLCERGHRGFQTCWNANAGLCRSQLKTAFRGSLHRLPAALPQIGRALLVQADHRLSVGVELVAARWAGI